MNDDSTEKRMAGDYEVIQAVHIGDREVVLGENPQDETGMKYMCAFCRQNALFAEYSEVMASDDFPDPDTPAIPTILFRGISTSMFLRLWTFAPRTRILSAMEGL